MLPARLHALGWNSPSFGGKVDLVPACACDLANSGSGQNEKFQSAWCNALALAKISHEERDKVVIQTGVVIDFVDGVTRRQRMFQITGPARRVITVAIAAHLGEIQSGFDPASHAARGFGRAIPNLLDG